MSELDLSAASAGAFADIEAANAGAAPAAESTPAAEAAPVEAAPAEEVVTSEETPAEEPAAEEAQPETTKDEPAAQKWTFTRKGQTVEITDPKQAADLIRQGYDYTQKTMELAETRRAHEARIRDILTNRDILRKQLEFLDAQQGVTATPTTPAPDGDDLISVSQAQQLVRAQLAQAQQEIAQSANRAILEAETSRYTQEYTGTVNRTLQTLVSDKFPILKDVDKIEKLILDDVSEQVAARIQMEPNEVVPIEDVTALLAAAAQKRAAKLEVRVKDHIKMEAVRAAKAVKAGIEPAGGTTPAPKATPKYKLGDPRLTELAIADLMASNKR